MVLGLTAVSALVGGEQLLALWLRNLARADGWYEIRRPFRLLALAIALGAGSCCLPRACGITLA